MIKINNLILCHYKKTITNSPGHGFENQPMTKTGFRSVKIQQQQDLDCANTEMMGASELK